MATPATIVRPTDSATMAMTVARPSDFVASRLQQLLQTEPNFRAVLPSAEVNEEKMRPELGLAQVMALVMEAYAGRPALAQRATELVTDPVSGQRTRRLLPQFESISKQAVTSLDCVRPYTPDIVGFASDWGDFISGVDGKDHYFRAQVQTLVPAPSNAMPMRCALRSLVTINAAAPSLVPGALPAVTVPSFLNAGRSLARASSVLSARGDSSRRITMGSPFFCGISTGTICDSM